MRVGECAEPEANIFSVEASTIKIQAIEKMRVNQSVSAPSLHTRALATGVGCCAFLYYSGSRPERSIEQQKRSIKAINECFKVRKKKDVARIDSCNDYSLIINSG